MKNTCIALITLLASLPLVAAASPSIIVSDAQRDLGEVVQGSTIDLEFTLENHSEEDVQIAVRPSCGCTVVDYDSTIPANSSGVIRASIDTAQFSGPITKSILVTTTDPENPRFSLVARATVQQIIEILPRPLVRLQSTVGQGQRSRITLAALPDNDFKITNISQVPDWLHTSFRPLTGNEMLPGRGATQYELVLELSDEAPAGFLNANLVVETDHPQARSLEIRVIGNISRS